jgi:hypothetical protein
VIIPRGKFQPANMGLPRFSSFGSVRRRRNKPMSIQSVGEFRIILKWRRLRTFPDDAKPTGALKLRYGLRRRLHRRRGRGVGTHKRRHRAQTNAATRERRVSQRTPSFVQAYCFPRGVKLPPAVVPSVSATILISEFSDRYLWY